MNKKELKKIATLCKQGVTFRRGVEIILRVNLSDKSQLLFTDRFINQIANNICDLDSLLSRKEKETQ